MVRCILVALIVISGCSTSATNGITTISSAPQSGNPVWVRSDIEPVSQPIEAGGKFVVYIVSEGNLQLVGLDPKSGVTDWSIDASTSNITPGVAPSLVSVAGYIPILFPTYGLSSGGPVKIAAVNPANGSIVWTGKSGVYSDWPAPCPGSLTDVCDEGQLSNSGSQYSTIFDYDGKTGRLASSTSIMIPGHPSIQTTYARQLAWGLYDPGARNPEYIMGVTGDTIKWSSPLSSLFPPGYTSDTGWQFDRVDADHLYVGSIEGPTTKTPTTMTENLANQMTLGFSIENGSIVWSDPGASYACGNLFECPGSNSPNAAAPTIGVRTREQGIATANLTTNKFTISSDASVVIEGFDLASGKTLWSFNAGHDVPMMTYAVLASYSAENVVLVPDAAGHLILLNLTNGSTSVAPSGQVMWCQSVKLYNLNQGGKSISYTKDPTTYPCDTSGNVISVPSHVPAFIGANYNGIVAFSKSKEIVAAHE